MAGANEWCRFAELVFGNSIHDRQRPIVDADSGDPAEGGAESLDAHGHAGVALVVLVLGDRIGPNAGIPQLIVRQVAELGEFVGACVRKEVECAVIERSEFAGEEHGPFLIVGEVRERFDDLGRARSLVGWVAERERVHTGIRSSHPTPPPSGRCLTPV